MDDGDAGEGDADLLLFKVFPLVVDVFGFEFDLEGRVTLGCTLAEAGKMFLDCVDQVLGIEGAE